MRTKRANRIRFQAGLLITAVCCLLLLARKVNAQPAGSGESGADRPAVPCAVRNDFWIDGVPPGLATPAPLAAAHRRGEMMLWGSWCDGNTQRVGSLFLGPFVAPAHFCIAVAGKPFTKSDKLILVRDSNQAQRIITRLCPGNAWRQLEVPVPADWVGQLCTLIAVDDGKTPDEWVGLSEPYTLTAEGRIEPLWHNRTAGLAWHVWLAEILGPLGLILLLHALIGIVGFSFVRRFLPTPPYLSPLLIAAMVGFAGYGTFWAYLLHPAVGGCMVIGVVLLGFWRIAYCLGRKNRPLLHRSDFNELKYALLLLLIAALFYLGLLWLPRMPGMSMDVMATHRPVESILPSDNVLQQRYAAAMARGESPKVMDLRQYSCTDRPPLEAGIQLLAVPVLVNTVGIPFDTVAQLSGMVMQLIWIFGAWALLRALGLTPRPACQIVLCLIPTTLLYLNSIYIWAKLSAAAYAIGFTVILCLRRKQPIGIGEAIAAALMMALALLSHAGAAFYLLPTVALWLIWPRPIGRPGWRTVVIVIATAAPLLLAWTCYQQFGDPPGNHLLKLNFAGVIDADNVPLSQTLGTAYGSLTLRQIVANKLANVATLFKGDWGSFFLPMPADRMLRRIDNFFYLFRSLGLFLLGVPALPYLLLRGDAELRGQVLFLLASLGLALILWCLLMFGAGSAMTIVHQGAYAVPIIILVLLAVALRRIHPAALLIVGVYNFAQFLWVYASPAPYPPIYDPLAVAVLASTLTVWLGLLLHGFERAPRIGG